MAHFERPELSAYAESLMLDETRKGLTSMAVVSLVIQLAVLALNQRLNLQEGFVYTYALLALLSLHVVISARFVRDSKALNLLGTVLLIITGVATMMIAHRGGSLDASLLASIVLLFMVMPLVPWGLRDALVVVAIVYVTFTLSTLSVKGRFDSEALWTLQFLIVASSATAMLVIMRNVLIRKHDIRARFELEDAHGKLQLLATRDALTGAWNRRYLDQNFAVIAHAARSSEKALHLAILDVDSFKALNDAHGHHFGDEVLRRLVHVLVDNLSGTAHVLRLGGDEFAVLDTSDDFEASVRRCLHHLETDPRLLDVNGGPVRVSSGFAAVLHDQRADLDELYRAADMALYEHKERRRNNVVTGRWRTVPEQT
jgi:diguanylate cyclase (GGDEF)-like protein